MLFHMNNITIYNNINMKISCLWLKKIYRHLGQNLRSKWVSWSLNESTFTYTECLNMGSRK